jgi:RND family efflux transporter MFP subunit
MNSNEPRSAQELREAARSLASGGQRPRRFPRRLLLIATLLAAVALTYVFGVQPRIDARAALKKEAAARSTMVVSVVQPKQASASRELILPGNMQAYSDAPIYARTSGYMKRWHADIGKHVKAGELLAEIDTPEVDDQLQQARADLASAEGNFRLAESTAARWEALLRTDSVSRQEVDERRSDFAVKKSALDAARFNVARLQKLQAFKRLYAPFDGVITARKTDVGALIDAGAAGGPGKELFHIAATRKLRVYVNVPQANARDAVPGVAAELTLPEFPGRRFKGTLVRTARAIDASSRTLQAEVEVDNPESALLPGGYAEVHLKLGESNRALLLPVNALLFRPEGVMVGVVQQDQRALLTPIVLGRDFGTEVEVTSGLGANDTVILNPSDSLASGAEVRVVKDEPAKPKS